MSDQAPVPSDIVNLDAWVREASDDSAEQITRRVIRIIVHAVSINDQLRELMVIKGGVLLAAAYRTGRHTRDVDFSTRHLASRVDVDSLCQTLNEAVERSAAMLDESLDCRVQGKRMKPPSPGASFPTLRVQVGYAERGSRAHKRLLRGNSPHVVLFDLSFNENFGEPIRLKIDGSAEIRAYSLVDQIAEKYRAVIQQQSRYRSRVRRQDAYDIYQILTQGYLESAEERRALLDAIKATCRSRGVDVSAESILEPEVRSRSRKEYSLLQDEIEGDLVDFDEMFDRVVRTFVDLPWNSEENA